MEGGAPSPRAQTALIWCVLIAAFGSSSAAQDLARERDSLTALGNKELARSNTFEARRLFEAALDIDERSIPALTGLGKCALADQDWTGACDAFNPILELDSANIPAHYYAGIAYRESGTQRALLFRSLQWNTAEEHFEWVLARDSLYSDVLLQYALLARYRGDYDEAFALAHAQVRKKPEATSGQLGLFKLYQYFIAFENPTVVALWLKGHPSPHARYFEGEQARLQQQDVDARRMFDELLATPGGIPPQAMWLSLARMTAARGAPDSAEGYYWRAVDNITTWLGAALLFEDLKHIITDEELTLYTSLASDRKKAAFFHAFWDRRDPAPAQKTNIRLAEHFRRYARAEQEFRYGGFRSWFNNPDKLQELQFPRSFRLNDEFNDMGIILLRYGEPDAVERTAGHSTNTGHTTWIYYASGGEPQRMFHFLSSNPATNSWRLAAVPEDPEMIERLSIRDTRYYDLLRASPIELLKRQEVIKEESRVSVSTVLSEDRHTWSKETRTLRIPHAIDAFRSEGGKTLVDISYAIPLEQLMEELPGDVSAVPIEVGLSISRPNGEPMASRLDTLRLPRALLSSGSYMSLYRYRLVPDSVRVNMHVRPLGMSMIGTWVESRRIPAFTSDDFLVSDLQFLLPSSLEPSIEINGVKVMQSPFTTIPRDNPLHVYLQLYNLVKNGDGDTRYTARYSVFPGTSPEGGSETVLFEQTVDGRDAAAAEFRLLDVSGLGTGIYTLTAALTDRMRVKTLVRTRLIELVSP